MASAASANVVSLRAILNTAILYYLTSNGRPKSLPVNPAPLTRTGILSLTFRKIGTVKIQSAQPEMALQPSSRTEAFGITGREASPTLEADTVLKCRIVVIR